MVSYFLSNAPPGSSQQPVPLCCKQEKNMTERILFPIKQHSLLNIKGDDADEKEFWLECQSKTTAQTELFHPVGFKPAGMGKCQKGRKFDRMDQS
jgi:hypothetical protein